jgi:hypothetical protein
MNERCKHIGKDGYRCGSYAFNLYKDDIDQGELCDVHFWQTKAQRTWVGLTDEEFEYLRDNNFGVSPLISAVEAKLKELNI